MPKIEPTVGRVVWFTPAKNDSIAVSDQPLAATIAHVLSDGDINIGVLDIHGKHHDRTNVFLWDGEGEPPEGGYCEWMPYQKGQAAKTEAAEAKVVSTDKDFDEKAGLA